MGDAEYIIYGKPNCSYCVAAVEFLEHIDVTFDYINLDESPEDLQFIKDNGFTRVPQVFQGDDHIGGYTDLLAHVNNR